MLIEWTPTLLTGNDQIDHDHHYIIGRVNEIWDKLDHGIDRHEMEDMLLDYCNYCSRHFHYEEDFMVEHQYPDYKLHKLCHKEMLDFFESMMLRFEIVKDVSRDQLRVFVTMIAAHIENEDKRMAAFVHAAVVEEQTSNQPAIAGRPGAV